VCFALDTVSFVAAIWTLRGLRSRARAKPDADGKSVSSANSSVWAGMRVAFGDATIRNLLILTVFTSFFGFQFSALLPVFVSDVFHSSATTLGFLAAASAIGSLGASLFLASRGTPAALARNIRIASLGVPATLLLFALSRNVFLTAGIELFIGGFISMQMNSANSMLQLRVSDEVRGRVMSIYSMILLGAVPFGSVAIGSLTDQIGAPWAVAVCAIACFGAGLFYVTRKTKGN
jgi:predicted MFS family arabinose efflux permease